MSIRNRRIGSAATFVHHGEKVEVLPDVGAIVRRLLSPLGPKPVPRARGDVKAPRPHPFEDQPRVAAGNIDPEFVRVLNALDRKRGTARYVGDKLTLTADEIQTMLAPVKKTLATVKAGAPKRTRPSDVQSQAYTSRPAPTDTGRIAPASSIAPPAVACRGRSDDAAHVASPQRLLGEQGTRPLRASVSCASLRRRPPRPDVRRGVRTTGRSPQTVRTVPPSMMNSAPWIAAARSEAK
jgi:hypothetical protein